MAAEYIIGGDMYEFGGNSLCGGGQIAGTVGVYGKRFVVVALGFVDSGLGCGIDDGIGLEVFHHI